MLLLRRDENSPSGLQRHLSLSPNHRATAPQDIDLVFVGMAMSLSMAAGFHLEKTHGKV
jgi:hypothetical protein